MVVISIIVVKYGLISHLSEDWLLPPSAKDVALKKIEKKIIWRNTQGEVRLVMVVLLGFTIVAGKESLKLPIFSDW